MKYDFVSSPNRKGVGAFKWDLMYQTNPNELDEIIPFSVADMELKNPPELLQGMSEFAANAVYGYTGSTQAYCDAVIQFMKKRHNWEIKKEWIVHTPGVVPALYQLINTFTKPGEGVIIMRPVYYPFTSAVEDTGRRLVNVALKETNGCYTIDFDALEKAAAEPDVKAIIICNPHNPVGRVWTREELSRLSQICMDNDVLIISDEIHFDFIMKGYQHTVLSSISEEVAQKSIVCTAPSKTFNIAGAQVSNIIIQNESMREKFLRSLKAGGAFTLNMFAYKACELVYNNCCDWFDELLRLIEGNKKLLEDYISKNIPSFRVSPLEGTYLVWIDCRSLGLSHEELGKFMQEKAHLYFDEGNMFGPEGDGFVRWNIACPKEKLYEGLERLNHAVKKLTIKGV